jgi:hypothetical protein
MTMTAAQFEQLGELEVEHVLRWRFEELTRVGYDAGEAMILASHVEVDLHRATDLIARGCPTPTAMRILL